MQYTEQVRIRLSIQPSRRNGCRLPSAHLLRDSNSRLCLFLTSGKKLTTGLSPCRARTSFRFPQHLCGCLPEATSRREQYRSPPGGTSQRNNPSKVEEFPHPRSDRWDGLIMSARREILKGDGWSGWIGGLAEMKNVQAKDSVPYSMESRTTAVSLVSCAQTLPIPIRSASIQTDRSCQDQTDRTKHQP